MIEAMRNGLDPVVERKFKNLRKRLDQLGFRQPLGIESVPLVERCVPQLRNHNHNQSVTCSVLSFIRCTHVD